MCWWELGGCTCRVNIDRIFDGIGWWTIGCISRTSRANHHLLTLIWSWTRSWSRALPNPFDILMHTLLVFHCYSNTNSSIKSKIKASSHLFLQLWIEPRREAVMPVSPRMTWSDVLTVPPWIPRRISLLYFILTVAHFEFWLFIFIFTFYAYKAVPCCWLSM